MSWLEIERITSTPLDFSLRGHTLRAFGPSVGVFAGSSLSQSLACRSLTNSGQAYIFKPFIDADMVETASLVRNESYGKIEQIFSEGAPSHWFYAVYEGKVKINKLFLSNFRAG